MIPHIGRTFRQWKNRLTLLGIAFLFWLGYVTHQALLARQASAHFKTRSHTSTKLRSQTYQEVVHIMLTSDSNTIMGTMAAINSVICNTKLPKDHLRFHIVTEPNSTDDFSQYIDWSKLHNLKYDVKAFNTSWLEGKIRLRVGRAELAKPMNYARYFYPKFYPDIQGKFIHLDNDVIVQGDILGLYKTKLEGTPIALLDDCSAYPAQYNLPVQREFKDYINLLNSEVKRVNIQPQTCSYNTGVFVGHMERWRHGMYSEKMLYWLALNKKEDIYGNEKGGGGSQPPMMLAFYKNYTRLEPLWHLQHLGDRGSLVYPMDLIRKANLLHWNGHRKPWKANALHTRLWDKYFVPCPSDKFQPEREIEEIKS